MWLALPAHEEDRDRDTPKSEALSCGQTTLGDQATTVWEDFRNQLIWGDNRLVMASLLKEFRGKIDLIYIDPSLMLKEAEIIIYLNQ